MGARDWRLGIADCGLVIGLLALGVLSAGAQTPASVSCLSPTVPVSGGAFSSLGSTSVSLNTTYPNGAGWTSYENNGSTLGGTVTSYAICAGT